MNLYLIVYEGESYYVHAPSAVAAIKAWHRWCAEGRDGWDGSEDPDSVTSIECSALILGEA